MAIRDIPGLIAGGIRQLAGCCGWNLYKYASDRRVLEQVILPYLEREREFSRLLFVGCAWYTQHYSQGFQAKEFWTLEADPARRKFGAQRHVTDYLQNVGRHFEAAGLDVIVCNGLLGWGLNRKPDIEEAFDACVDSLRPGGLFILGWDDIPIRRPCLPEDCASLRRLTPYCLPPLECSRHLTKSACRHTFDFYRKPDPATDSPQTRQTEMERRSAGKSR